MEHNIEKGRGRRQGGFSTGGWGEGKLEVGPDLHELGETRTGKKVVIREYHGKNAFGDHHRGWTHADHDDAHAHHRAHVAALHETLTDAAASRKAADPTWKKKNDSAWQSLKSVMRYHVDMANAHNRFSKLRRHEAGDPEIRGMVERGEERPHSWVLHGNGKARGSSRRTAKLAADVIKQFNYPVTYPDGKPQRTEGQNPSPAGRSAYDETPRRQVSEATTPARMVQGGAPGLRQQNRSQIRRGLRTLSREAFDLIKAKILHFPSPFTTPSGKNIHIHHYGGDNTSFTERHKDWSPEDHSDARDWHSAMHDMAELDGNEKARRYHYFVGNSHWNAYHTKSGSNLSKQWKQDNFSSEGGRPGSDEWINHNASLGSKHHADAIAHVEAVKRGVKS